MSIRRKPKGPTRRELAYGEPFNDTNLNDQWIERGNIVAVNPPTCTCNVETETRGRFNGVHFPYLVQDPEGCGGRVYVPRVGQQVVVQQGIGTPFISLGLPTSTDSNAGVGASAAFTEAATYSKGALSFSPAAPADYAAQLPRSLLPGDWMWLGNQGQHLALLDGGVAAMLASPWSQVSCSQEDDTTTVIGRNMNIVTGFGNIRFFDDAGKSGMLFEGRTDQTLESGYGRDNWTVQAKIGGDAEGLFDFRINNRDGEAVAKTIWKADGSVVNMTSGDQEQTFDGNMGLTYNGDLLRSIKGSEIISVGLDRTENFAGSHTTAVSQNRSCDVLNDRPDIISRDWSMSAGRVHSLKVS